MDNTYMKIGDLKLLNIQVKEGDNTVYSGKVEEAPDDIKARNYKKAIFDSGFIILEI